MKFVSICERCGRGAAVKPGEEILVDRQPIWYMTDSSRGKDAHGNIALIESEMCNGRFMRVERSAQIARVEAEAADV